MRQWRVGTITMGILLIALGIIMIIARVNGISAMEHIIKWWPVILILLGLEVLVFSLLPSQEHVRVKFDGFSIFMVVIIIVISLGAYGFTSAFQSIKGLNFFNISNQSKYRTILDKKMTVNVNGSQKLVVKNSFGSVQLTKGTGENIEVEANMIIYNNDEDYAREIADSLIEIAEGDDIRITSKREKFLNDRGKVQNINTNLIIKVPEGFDIDIENRFGSISTEGVGKSAKILNEHGEVNVKSVEGDLFIKNSFAGIYAEGVKGKAEVNGKNGSVTLKAVGEDLIVDNSFGTVKIEEVKGNTQLTNSNGKIEVHNIEGSLIVNSKFCQIDVTGVKGNLEVEGNNGSIKIDTVDGDVKAVNKFGTIELLNANKYVDLITTNGTVNFKSRRVIEKGVNIENQFGSISIEIPKEQSGQFKAYTKYGKIQDEFNFDIKKESNEETLDGKIGESSVLFNFNNKNGDIRISSR